MSLSDNYGIENPTATHINGYNKLINEVSRKGLLHCDSRVLHAPGLCKYCDQYPELQQWRADHEVNFTGEHHRKYLCFAEVERPEQTINQWPGNRAQDPEDAFELEPDGEDPVAEGGPTAQ